MNRDYTIEENGHVLLPPEWWEKYGLVKGETVALVETANGILITSRKALVSKLLDELGDELRARGVTLDELIESGRDIRAELLKEKYGIDIADE